LDFHGAFSDADRSVVEARVESARRDLLFFQKKARYVLLTLGTADGFEWAATGRMVANCHKIPAAQFRSRRLSVAEVTDALAAALTTWRVAQPDLRAIVTVSPVRHLRGGLVANQRSKATLLLAAEALCAVLPWADYFPAYELVIDDLRDYRFFAADMVHPSDVAIDYVWQHFADAYFSPETQVLCQQISRLAAAIGHRPFNPDTPQHRAFVAQQLVEVARLEAAHGLDFSTERVLLGRYA
jgi:GSCFA family